MTDPFAQFMAHWEPTDGRELAFHAYLEKMRQQGRESAYVMPDIEPFKSNDGAHISGRAGWREHLKVNNFVELGHSDIKHQGEQWQKRKEAQRARIKPGATADMTASVPSDFQPSAPSRLQIEIANRLHGRPAPARREFIRLALDQAKRMKHG
jgi:hypothetical protein